MNKIILVLLGSSVGLGLVSLHLVRELRGERSNSQALQARIEALQSAAPAPMLAQAARPADAPPPAPPPPQGAGATFTVTPAMPMAVASVSAAGSGVMPQMPSKEERVRMMRESMERQRALMQNPEYREAMMAQQKMMLARQYSDVEEEMGLDADQYEQMLTLLANQQLRRMENQQPWEENPDPSAMGQLHRKYQQQQQADDAELAAFLGADKAQAWKEYQSSMGVRFQVNQLRTTLATAGTPLQQDQVKPLQKAIANEQQRMMKEYEKASKALSRTTPGTQGFQSEQWGLQEQHIARMKESNKRVRDAVSSVLSTEQLRQLEREQNEQVQMQEAQMRMMRAQAAAAANGEIAPMPQSGLTLQEGPVEMRAILTTD